MLKVIERALQIAEVDCTVFVQGESGVGKEGIANLIHQYSNRTNKPMISINCGAIPEQLLESELFGYEAGAFTGACPKGKPGLFEIATGGTIFLNEICVTTPSKVLRVLQEYELTRIGGSHPIKVNVRVIAATNQTWMRWSEKDIFVRICIIAQILFRSLFPRFARERMTSFH